MDDTPLTEDTAEAQKDVGELLREAVDNEKSRILTISKGTDVFNVELIEANGIEFRSLQDRMANLQVQNARLTAENNGLKELIEKANAEAEKSDDDKTH